MMESVLWMLAAAAGMLAILTLVLFEVYRELRRARKHAEAAERHQRDLTNFVRLLRDVTGSDWQRAMQALLSALVSQGYAKGAVLLAVNENGQLENRGSTFADENAAWDALADVNSQNVLNSRERVVDRQQARLYLPVQQEGEVVGVLAMTGADAVVAHHEDELFLEAVAQMAAVALVSLRAFQKQVALSTTDGLTGLINHRHFQQIMGVTLAQTYLQGSPLPLIMFDLDHFKSINDTYGHLFGDLVLREIAHVTRRLMPSHAQIARYGGEEFAVLLPNTAPDSAVSIAERLRAGIEEHQILDFATGTKVRVTISVGVAFYQLGLGKPRLIQRADEALYASKHGGRNRVTVATAEEAAVAAGSDPDPASSTTVRAVIE